jgi:hypothetical protein
LQFTERAEEAIKKGSLNSYLKELKSQLESYTSVDLSGGDDEAKVLELKLKALILVGNILRCFVSTISRL